jgi:hypothetical protein
VGISLGRAFAAFLLVFAVESRGVAATVTVDLPTIAGAYVPPSGFVPGDETNKTGSVTVSNWNDTISSATLEISGTFASPTFLNLANQTFSYPLNHNIFVDTNVPAFGCCTLGFGAGYSAGGPDFTSDFDEFTTIYRTVGNTFFLSLTYRPLPEDNAGITRDLTASVRSRFLLPLDPFNPLFRGASVVDRGSANIDRVSLTFRGSAVQAVPEPSTWLLLVAGFLFVGVGLRHARAQQISLRCQQIAG